MKNMIFIGLHIFKQFIAGIRAELLKHFTVLRIISKSLGSTEKGINPCSFLLSCKTNPGRRGILDFQIKILK